MGLCVRYYIATSRHCLECYFYKLQCLNVYALILLCVYQCDKFCVITQWFKLLTHTHSYGVKSTTVGWGRSHTIYLYIKHYLVIVIFTMLRKIDWFNKNDPYIYILILYGYMNASFEQIIHDTGYRKGLQIFISRKYLEIDLSIKHGI